MQAYLAITVSFLFKTAYSNFEHLILIQELAIPEELAAKCRQNRYKVNPLDASALLPQWKKQCGRSAEQQSGTV